MHVVVITPTEHDVAVLVSPAEPVQASGTGTNAELVHTAVVLTLLFIGSKERGINTIELDARTRSTVATFCGDVITRVRTHC